MKSSLRLAEITSIAFPAPWAATIVWGIVLSCKRKIKNLVNYDSSESMHKTIRDEVDYELYEMKNALETMQISCRQWDYTQRQEATKIINDFP